MLKSRANLLATLGGDCHCRAKVVNLRAGFCSEHKPGFSQGFSGTGNLTAWVIFTLSQHQIHRQVLGTAIHTGVHSQTPAQLLQCRALCPIPQTMPFFPTTLPCTSKIHVQRNKRLLIAVKQKRRKFPVGHIKEIMPKSERALICGNDLPAFPDGMTEVQLLPRSGEL